MKSPDKFIGRKSELKLLENKYQSSKSELVVIYGRRRIGKSRLIEQFTQGKNCLCFEGLEGEYSADQIKNFNSLLKEQFKEPLLEDLNLKSWRKIFQYLSNVVFPKIAKKNKKTIIVFDEFQWMAANQGKLISLLKYFWDNYWKKQNIMLILSGSIASFMVNKVIKSKALYGRTTLEILLKALKPHEYLQLFNNKRCAEEALEYLLVFGGIPKYAEEITLNHSFQQNINSMCFSSNGYMVKEIDKIFYSQFSGTADTYRKIADALKDKILSLSELAAKLKMPSGGGLTRYLNNLETAGLISSYRTFGSKKNTKFVKYKLTDEFLIFYYKFMDEYIDIIQENEQAKLFNKYCQANWQIWLGFAFERFCVKNSLYLAYKMGFGEEVVEVAPYFGRNDQNFQIDLLYKRADKVITLCEVKYYNSKITPQVIKEIERKENLFQLPKGYTLEKALISLHGPSKELKEIEYFHHYLTLDDIFSC